MSLEDRKKEKMEQLNEQAAILHANLTALDGLVEETCIQNKAVLQLGMMHGALFMGSHQVYGDMYERAKQVRGDLESDI